MEITHPNRDGVKTRPCFKYDYEGRTFDSSQLEMLESIRNTLEAIHGSQMLQCDVARAIKGLAETVKRIDRRLAKVEGMKLR
jgi:hypothetical protein